MPNTEWTERLAKLVTEIAGIQLGAANSAMIQSRLTKRMLDLGISDPAKYLHYVEDHKEDETQVLISLLTTHHTFFFREFKHFEYLGTVGLPKVIPILLKENRPLRIWSAASSRGQEAYSLAMFLEHYLQSSKTKFRYEIFGSDIDQDSVAIAKNGVYRWDELKEVPRHFLADHWIRGTGEISDYAKISKTIRAHCTFEVMNLLDVGGVKLEKFDFIFCRNVFIYFNQQQIKAITQELMKHLYPHGDIFVGLSESLLGMNLGLKPVAPSVYAFENAPKTFASYSDAKQLSKMELPNPIRVMCVDDSPTVLTLLKKVLDEKNGFKIVGTAKNGVEAHELLRSTPCDAMTLDIHMPEMTGVEYLEKYYSNKHPPVVVVSSVSRDDADTGARTLKAGASDFVEKPTLGNIEKCAEQLRTKIKTAVAFKTASKVSVEASFAKSIRVGRPDKVLRVINLGQSGLTRLKDLMRGLHMPQPPLVIVLEQSGVDAQAANDLFLKSTVPFKIEDLAQQKSLQQNTCYIARSLGQLENTLRSNQFLRVNLLSLGAIPDSLQSSIRSLKNASILYEETAFRLLPDHKRTTLANTVAIVPITSLMYHSDEDLSKYAA